MGDSAGALRQILSRAAAEADAPVVVVSGHHHEIGENTFRIDADGVVHLNLPSALYTDDVTDGEIVFTGMNFLTGETLADYAWRVVW